MNGVVEGKEFWILVDVPFRVAHTKQLTRGGGPLKIGRHRGVRTGLISEEDHARVESDLPIRGSCRISNFSLTDTMSDGVTGEVHDKSTYPGTRSYPLPLKGHVLTAITGAATGDNHVHAGAAVIISQ